MKIKTKVKLVLPLSGEVMGVVFLNDDKEVVGGMPLPSGWFPAVGDSLTIEYAPEPFSRKTK